MSATISRLALILVGLLAITTACGDDDAGTTTTPTVAPTQSHPPATATATPGSVGLPIPNPTEIYVVATNGGGEKLLYASEGYPTYAWSPDGETLAVAEGGEEETTVLFLDVEGTVKASVSHNGFWQPLSWSPDGMYVATVASDSNSADVLVIAADGSEENVVLTEDSGSFPLIAGWLPSGELLVLNSSGSAGKLLAIDVQEDESRTVSEQDVIADFFGKPELSPDEETLAVFGPAETFAPCEGGSGTAVYTIEIETGDATRVTPEPQCGAGGLVWSPDGDQIAFSALPISASAGSFTVDIASGTTTRLSTGFNNAVAWLDDGTIVAQKYPCVSCDGGPPSTLVIDSESGEVEEISGNVPTAIADNGKIVVADDDLQVFDASDQEPATLVTLEEGWNYSVAWVPGEASVSYSRSRAQGEHYFAIDADGSDYEFVGSFGGTAKLSPDGSRVAYIMQNDIVGGPELWLADSDGGDAARVDVEGSTGLFAWSPDGSRLIGSSLNPATRVGSEFIVDADGTGLRPLNTESVADKSRSGPPIWAPNGELVMFFGDPTTVIDVDEGTQTKFQTPGQKSAAAWSGDSEKIVYSLLGEPSEAGLFVLDLESGQTEEIEVDEGLPNGPIAVSGDNRIAYFADDDDSVGVHDLRVVDIDGDNDTLVLESVSNATAPSWSPDGEQIALAVVNDEASGLFVVGADGEGARQLTRGTYFNEILWVDDERLRVSSFIGGL